jgi:hypothetical protein
VRRIVLGVLVLVLTSVAAPARADSTYGSVSGIDGVLYDDCISQPYLYAVHDVPPDATDWGIDVSLYDPKGRMADSDFVDSAHSAGSRTFQLCAELDPYGTYTIRATFKWEDSGSAWHYTSFDETRFTMRKPRSRTTLTVSTRRPASGQVVRYRITAYDERPGGFGRRAFAWVHLEKRSAGHWVRVKGSRAMTHSTGAVRVRLRYLGHHRTTRLRAVTERTSRYSRSFSPVLRLW